MTQAALPILRTPRLVLRPLQDDDAEAIVRGVGNFDVSKWLAVVPYPYDVEDAHVFLKRVAAQDNPFWAICDSNGLCGIISLDDELAYWLARDVWGRGYGFEAAVAVVKHWFSDPKAGQLTSGYFDGNDRSGTLLRALSFVPSERITRYAKSFQQDVVSNQMVLSRAAWDARMNVAMYTPRLTLREMRKQDASALIDLAHPTVTRMLFSLPSDLSPEGAASFIAARRWQGHSGFALALEHKEKMIGYVAFSETRELYYALHPDHWRAGLMTEAISAFLPAVFSRFPLGSIVADHFEDNPASGAVLRKFGFVETGHAMGSSKARLEPARVITYALSRENLKVPV